VSLLVRALTEKAALRLSAEEIGQTVEVPAGSGYGWTEAFRLEAGQGRCSVLVEVVEGEAALRSVRFTQA
jgi:hypothetical protein